MRASSSIAGSTQKGRPFLVAALLENEMIFQHGSGHRARIMVDASPRTFEFGTELESVSHAVTILKQSLVAFKNFFRTALIF
jgi:hypothetical protein